MEESKASSSIYYAVFIPKNSDDENTPNAPKTDDSSPSTEPRGKVFSNLKEALDFTKQNKQKCKF